jgi:hypothetical protein
MNKTRYFSEVAEEVEAAVSVAKTVEESSIG